MKYRLLRCVVIMWVLASTGLALAQTPPTQAPAQNDPEPENRSARFSRFQTGMDTCLLCHGSYNISAVGAEGRPEPLWISPELFNQSVHASLGCVACHTNIDAHGHKLVKDEAQQFPAKSETNGAALQACITCHPKEYALYKTSIHGVDVINRQESEPPFCTDCHGSHYILPATDERAWTNPSNVPATCLRCHGEAKIVQRFGLTKDVGGTFKESFHGMRSEIGSVSVAVCTSCHGSHDIYAAADPRSKVNAANVSKTCGKCHEGAQLNFAAAFTHRSVNAKEQIGLYILKQIYMYFIVFVIGQFIVLIALDLFRIWVRRKAAKDA
jgi:nitrate/TMAO reductase-like tetraheme cytochrome c subunit